MGAAEDQATGCSWPACGASRFMADYELSRQKRDESLINEIKNVQEYQRRQNDATLKQGEALLEFAKATERIATVRELQGRDYDAIQKLFVLVREVRDKIHEKVSRRELMTATGILIAGISLLTPFVLWALTKLLP